MDQEQIGSLIVLIEDEEKVMLDASPQKVLQLIDKGIKKAEEYQIASGLPFWEGPEYLITMSIFNSILAHAKRDCLTLEISPSVIEEYMELKGRPTLKPESARMNGRGDICLWFVETNVPRAIIEVKRNAKDCHYDLNRVIALIDHKNGLKFGVLASCIREEIKNGNTEENVKIANNSIEDKLEIISGKIKETIDTTKNIGFELIDSPFEKLECDGDKPGEIKNWVWRPVCYHIYKK